MNTITYPACDLASSEATINQMTRILLKHWGYAAPMGHDFSKDEHPKVRKALRIARDLYYAFCGKGEHHE